MRLAYDWFAVVWRFASASGRDGVGELGTLTEVDSSIGIGGKGKVGGKDDTKDFPVSVSREAKRSDAE